MAATELQENLSGTLLQLEIATLLGMFYILSLGDGSVRPLASVEITPITSPVSASRFGLNLSEKRTNRSNNLRYNRQRFV